MKWDWSVWLAIGIAKGMSHEMPLKWVAACWGYYDL